MVLAHRLFPLLAGAVLCAAASLNPLGAQQPTGTITGQVIDSATRQPLAGVNVVVEGTRLGAVTRDDGSFTIAGVPAGTHTLRARRIGYGSVPVVISVSDGATALQPRGRVHYFINDSPEPMAMLWVYAGPMPERVVLCEGCCS